MCSGTSLPGTDEQQNSHVIVFDDITALVQGQRNAAWSEMAQRLAHEIKNPLTPIQLATERLRHKYLQTMADAEELCRNSTAVAANPQGQAAMQKLIAGRRRTAGGALADADAALRAGDLAAARERFARARAQDRNATAVAGLQGRLQVQLARHYASRLRGATPAALATVLAALGHDRIELPELLEEKALVNALGLAADRFHTRLMQEFRRDGVAAARRLHQEIPALLSERGKLYGVQPALELLADAMEARDRGDLQGAADCLRLAGTDLGSPEVKQIRAEVEAELETAASALWSARALLASGRLVAAREALLQVLEKWPSHQPARREMEILNEQARDRDERLSRARALAAESRLQAASALLLELAKDDQQGQEARLMLKEVQARMDLVSEGVAQVRRALHGQASSSQAGLQHCLARLDELTKEQADAEEVRQLRQALMAEIAGLETLDRLAEAVAAERPADAAIAMEQFLPHRASMQPPQRLEARFWDLADTVLHRVDAAVQAARLSLAREWHACSRRVRPWPAPMPWGSRKRKPSSTISLDRCSREWKPRTRPSSSRTKTLPSMISS